MILPFALALATLALLSPERTGEHPASGPAAHEHAAEPAAPPVYAPTSTVAGQVPAVASGLDVAKLTGSKGLPPSAAPDVVGAFRFLCGPGQVNRDDPLVYPNEPGRAHLHQWFGNLRADARSTYESLRTTGDSTCMNALNRSAYWIPAMLDGKGNVVRPDYVSIYYKRRPSSDPFCQPDTGAGKCVGLPRGLRYIFGWDQFRPTEDQPENTVLFNWKCIGGGKPATAVSQSMVEPMKACSPRRQLIGTVSTQLCWDGKRLDTPNHRAHMANMRRDRFTDYKPQCPRTHPYILPQFTLGATYSVEAGDEPTRWSLSSDHMKPGGAPGSTFHADWFGAWEDGIQQAWETACIERLRNASDGDLCDGRIMARGPHYPKGKANPRLVPVPDEKGAAASS